MSPIKKNNNSGELAIGGHRHNDTKRKYIPPTGCLEVHEIEKTQRKQNTAHRWADALNNLKDFGRLDFLVCRDLSKFQPSSPNAPT